MRFRPTLFASVLVGALVASATHSYADGAFLVAGTNQSPCASITVIGNGNSVDCDSDGITVNGQFFPSGPQPNAYDNRLPAPFCVTPYGNRRMMQPVPYYARCWVGNVEGWSGDFSDNFFFPPF